MQNRPVEFVANYIYGQGKDRGELNEEEML